MGFRPAGALAIDARSCEAQITLSATKTTAANMSTTFSANFGPAKTVVLPYTKLSLPAGFGTGGNPNAVLWQFPFKEIFAYSAANGNLLWDWRHKDSTSTTGAFDFVSFAPTTPTLASRGTGCTATGQSSPATSTIVLWSNMCLAKLANGRANSPVFAAIGMQRSGGALWCGNLYVVPQFVVGGVTNAAGMWSALTFPASTLSFTPYAEAYVQYAIADENLAGGVGLSNYSIGGPPANGSRYICRVWNVSTTDGAQTATTGSRINGGGGLITTFTIR
jgi:hypothetical protein